jgi:two-component system, NtrC family, C4-dicarboxylate transport response regulator DctD
VLPVHLPPLRERKEDIPLLVDYFWNEYCDGQHSAARPCTPELIHRLMQQDWPGNVRELRNYVRRYCVLGTADPAGETAAEPVMAHGSVGLSWKAYMEQQERLYVEQILRQVGGQVSAAHQVMGISRKSLYDKINKYGIELHLFREEGIRG